MTSDPTPVLNHSYDAGYAAYRLHDVFHSDRYDYPSFMTFASRFLNDPACPVAGSIGSKSGPQSDTVWTIQVSNPIARGKSYATQVDSFVLTQISGASCSPSIRTTFPLALGDVEAGKPASGVITIDFTGCPEGAGFAANASFSGNRDYLGKTRGTMVVNNQFQLH